MLLVWLDLETTGLDPRNDSILEIAMRYSDDMLLDAYEFNCVVAHDGRDLSTFIREMHSKNGLLGECAVSEVDTASADEHAAKWIDDLRLRLLGAESGPMTLAGSSVHFDLGFLRVHMPKLATKFSHRLFDVSAIKLFCESLGMPKLPKAEAHRAMPDVEESFAHFKKCVAWTNVAGSI